MKQATVTGKFIADTLIEKKKELDEVVESIRILKDNSTLSHSVEVPIRILDLQRQTLQGELHALSNKRYVVYVPPVTEGF